MRRRDRWDAYELHAAAIKRYVARRVEPDAVDDVVAETFAIAWRRLPRDGETPDWLLPWLYGVAKRVIHGHHRSGGRRAKLLARVAGHRDAAAAPDAAELIDGDPQLARAFATLTEREREAISLIAWEGLSQRDAARAAGCSEPTFAVRYSRARSRLAAALDPHARLAAEPAHAAAAAPGR
jgi:RNA polymerase sigma-70 factor, ECF subfamily